ncbi:hypothetical protein PsorP6_009885 [Peronosclerospora sorghi]|uniref:Uncharacterized protein n=1 Tax=Peronosclerospora sorghi TaxID=230839 RepID=A0ACC0VYK6_9STRA|nr:hypothetical protein PsorP6_009885 [Peronosclerospora sorghi]
MKTVYTHLSKRYPGRKAGRIRVSFTIPHPSQYLSSTECIEFTLVWVHRGSVDRHDDFIRSLLLHYRLLLCESIMISWFLIRSTVSSFKVSLSRFRANFSAFLPTGRVPESMYSGSSTGSVPFGPDVGAVHPKITRDSHLVVERSAALIASLDQRKRATKLVNGRLNNAPTALKGFFRSIFSGVVVEVVFEPVVEVVIQPIVETSLKDLYKQPLKAGMKSNDD